MDDNFYDIPVPRKREERNCPDDLSIHFTFIPQQSALRLDLHSESLPLSYGGKGRILLPDGFCRVGELSILDPFLTDRRFIPSKFFKIFFKASLPKLLTCQYCVTSDLYMGRKPALYITMNTADPDDITCLIKWNVDRGDFLFLEGFGDHAVSRGMCWPGPRHIINSLSHMPDGEHRVSKFELESLRGFYRDAPYLFKIEGGKFSPAPDKTAADIGAPDRNTDSRPGSGVRNTHYVQENFSFDSFNDISIPSRATHNASGQLSMAKNIPAPVAVNVEVDGPALISISHSGNARAENGKFTFFLLEAKRFAAYKPEKAEFVPFTCYWPVYSKMTRDQRAWYFYWRAQFREGEILKTDLSYIFVYIYEIINRAYGSAREGLDCLNALWTAYRSAFPRLDYYMPSYCADYMILNGLESELPSISAKHQLSAGVMRPFAELYINDILGEGLHALPFSTLCSMSDYKISQSRFYCANQELYRDTFIRVLKEIDKAMRASKDASLLSSFSPEPVMASWNAYNGALCGRAAARRINAKYIPYTSFEPLRTFIGAVMKHTENALRKLHKYAGRLRGYTLSEHVRALIDRTIGGTVSSISSAPSHSAEPSAPIEIDLSLANDLELASWENTRRLIDAVDRAQDNTPDEFETMTVQDVPEPIISPEPVIYENFDDVYDAFLASLSDFQSDFLFKILANADENSLSALAAQQFTFPEAVYEELNILAQNNIGDIILSPDGDIYEEHMQMLKNAFDHKGQVDS